MDSIPAVHCLRKTTTPRKRGEDRRNRFLLQFDDWRRHKHRTLIAALKACGMKPCIYHRWRSGEVVPRESALRRYCTSTGIDVEFVLTGIPGEIGKNHLTLRYYQDRHQEATTAHERLAAFCRISTEALLVLLKDFPTLVQEEIILAPVPTVRLRYMIDTLFRYEIRIAPLNDGQVGFEVFSVRLGVPLLSMEGWLDEGALRSVRISMQEQAAKHRRKVIADDVLTPQIRREEKFYAKYNARHNR